MDDQTTLRRRHLSEIRQQISNQTIENPFTLSSKLTSGEIIADFVVLVAINIHKKRIKK
jgi:hypothetical protein